MRFFSTVTEQTEALMAGTPEQRMRAQRERQSAEVAHAIISTSRADLDRKLARKEQRRLEREAAAAKRRAAIKAGLI